MGCLFSKGRDAGASDNFTNGMVSDFQRNDNQNAMWVFFLFNFLKIRFFPETPYFLDSNIYLFIFNKFRSFWKWLGSKIDFNSFRTMATPYRTGGNAFYTVTVGNDLNSDNPAHFVRHQMASGSDVLFVIWNIFERKTRVPIFGHTRVYAHNEVVCIFQREKAYSLKK